MRSKTPASPGAKSNITVENIMQKSKKEQVEDHDMSKGTKDTVDSDTERVSNDGSSFVPPIAHTTSPASPHRTEKKGPIIVRKQKSLTPVRQRYTATKEAQYNNPQKGVNQDGFNSQLGHHSERTRGTDFRPATPMKQKSISHRQSNPSIRSKSKRATKPDSMEQFSHLNNTVQHGTENPGPFRHPTPTRQPSDPMKSMPSRHSKKKSMTSTLNTITPPTPIQQSSITSKSAPTKGKTSRTRSTSGTYRGENSNISALHDELHTGKICSDDDDSDLSEKSTHDRLMLHRRQPYSPSTTKKVKRRNKTKQEVKPQSKSHRSTPFTSSIPKKSKTKNSEFDLKATELDDMNYAVEELLNENTSLKMQIEKYRSMKKTKKKSDVKVDCDYSKIISRQAESLKQREEENKKERRRYEKTKKKLEEKRQQCRSLLFATSYANATGRYRDISFYDQIRMEKENKVLTDEIGGLQRELSATLHVLEKTEKERNLCRSHIKQYISAVQILTEQKEELQEKNHALKQELQNMIEKEKYSTEENQEKMEKKEDLIRSLKSQLLSNSAKYFDNESEYTKSENSSQDLEHELTIADDLWAETQEDLATVHDTIENVKADQEKYRSNHNSDELEIAILREKKLMEIQNDLESILKAINEEKKYVFAKLSSRNQRTGQKNDSIDWKGPGSVTEYTERRNIGSTLLNHHSKQDLSSRMKEVDAFIDEYRKNKEFNYKKTRGKTQHLSPLYQKSESDRESISPKLKEKKTPHFTDINEEYTNDDDDDDELSADIAQVSQLPSIGTRSIFSTFNDDTSVLPHSPKSFQNGRNVIINKTKKVPTVPQLNSIGDVSSNEEVLSNDSLLLPNGRVRIPGVPNKSKSLAIETMLEELQHLYQPQNKKS